MAGQYKITDRIQFVADASGDAEVELGSLTGVLIEFAYIQEDSTSPSIVIRDTSDEFDILNGEGANLTASTKLTIDADFPVQVMSGPVKAVISGAGSGRTGLIQLKVKQL